MPKETTFNNFSDFLSKADSLIKDKLEKTIKLCCKKVYDDIQYSMAHTPRDMGKSYYTNNETIAHHPSLPGNPPAVDTGKLRESIRYDVYSEENEINGVVGTTQKEIPYGAYLEFGTSKGGWGGKGIAPRPWLRPAMQKNNEFIRTQLSKVIAEAFKGGMK